MLAGIYELHKKYGKISWNRLFDEAITIAEKGYQVSGDWVHDTNKSFSKLNKDAQRALTNDKPKKRLREGNILKQPRVGKLLREVQNKKNCQFL